MTPVCFVTTRPSLARTGLKRIRFPGFSVCRAHGRAQEQIAKVPLLGDIPLLGYLFRKKFVSRNRVELLIFVTTKIIPS